MTKLPEALLSVRNVSAAYGGAVAALHGVDLDLRRGEILALLGSNGAGKTTLLKAVSNLLPAERGALTGGEIRFEGRDVAESSPADLVRAGLVQVLEGRHCFRSLTVEENLLTGALGRSSSRAEAKADLEKVYDLFPWLAQKRRTAAGLTSGGEQQMTAIGRGLMSRPRLFVLDEPSMGLAPLVVREIFEALKRINAAEGLSLLVAEQNSAIALKYAHRAVVVENGRSVLTGSAAELAARDDIKSFYLGGADLPASSPQAKEVAA
ncbi:ABC transporter ATP-binding protein [Neomegalonema sp.]|uniref:ABC transporter ATP-binding protein n=1 Tax=Neomegalonema sp. TaxID=2039713 RepID=UPI002618D49D|nr:ABC transporter ATP-binding protein [Neomegalonema sp.]MDD2869335.1 ABC transporter ATP-binding protein [Neomegalonema sp.]